MKPTEIEVDQRRVPLDLRLVQLRKREALHADWTSCFQARFRLAQLWLVIVDNHEHSAGFDTSLVRFARLIINSQVLRAAEQAANGGPHHDTYQRTDEDERPNQFAGRNRSGQCSTEKRYHACFGNAPRVDSSVSLEFCKALKLRIVASRNVRNLVLVQARLTEDLKAHASFLRILKFCDKTLLMHRSSSRWLLIDFI